MSHSEIVTVVGGEHEVSIRWAALPNQPEQRVKLLHRATEASDWLCMRTFAKPEVIRLQFAAGEARLLYLPAALASLVEATIAPVKPKLPGAPEEYVEHTLQ